MTHHPTKRRTPLKLLAAIGAGALATFALPFAAHAQAWPTKGPIRLIAPFPPGGSIDQVSRILAPVLQEAFGQTVLVENKSGASGAIGTAEVARAAPDGYTWGLVFDTHGVNPALQPRMPFDTVRDLSTVVLLGTGAMVITAQSAQPLKSWADVVAGSSGGKSLTYGSIGNGSLGHLALTLLSKSTNINLVHVPYKGGGPLMQDAIAGHVQMAISSIFLAKPQIDSGRLRPLAVTTAQRSPALPNVPTLAELGNPNFEAPAWWAMVTSSKTPPELIKRMNAEVNKAMQRPDVAAKMAQQGISVNIGTPEQAQAFVEKQIGIWGKVVKEHHITSD